MIFCQPRSAWDRIASSPEVEIEKYPCRCLRFRRVTVILMMVKHADMILHAKQCIHGPRCLDERCALLAIG